MHSHPKVFDSEDNEFGEFYEADEREIKNEYSTFIEDLEETTEKLMNEVFDVEYRPEVD